MALTISSAGAYPTVVEGSEGYPSPDVSGDPPVKASTLEELKRRLLAAEAAAGRAGHRHSAVR